MTLVIPTQDQPHCGWSWLEESAVRKILDHSSATIIGHAPILAF
jgi:hypothetical protein